MKEAVASVEMQRQDRNCRRGPRKVNAGKQKSILTEVAETLQAKPNNIIALQGIATRSDFNIQEIFQ